MLRIGNQPADACNYHVKQRNYHQGGNNRPGLLAQAQDFLSYNLRDEKLAFSLQALRF